MATGEDAPEIVALLNQTFRTPIDEAAWDWYACRNPRGPSRVYVALGAGDGRIVGVIAFSPTHLRVRGETLSSVYAHHLAIKPAYRDTLSYFALTRFGLQGEAAQGVKLTIGPPNRTAYPIHKALTKWVDFGYLDCLRKPAPAARNHDCHDLASFTGSFDHLYSRISRDLAFCVEKTSTWMNWRFSSRPGRPYTVYAAQAGGELLGYVILKRWQEPDGYRKAHIVDLHALDDAVLGNLMAAAESYAAGCDELNLWAVKGYLYRGSLECMGFAPIQFRQPLIIRTFDGSPLAYPEGRCSLSYGDGDSLY
jgi:hypothetical protein